MNPTMRDHNKDLLLQVLMHYLPLDIRTKVVSAVPQAYNDYYGRTVIAVRYAEDADPVAAVAEARRAAILSAPCGDEDGAEERLPQIGNFS